MSERRRRGLTPEDQALWDQVAATVKRRRRTASQVALPTASTVASAAVATPPRTRIVLKPVGRPEPALNLINQAATPKSGLDGKRAERLRGGALAIEARIDLHGMTLDLAHVALGGFLVQARGRGHRCVLVITGKGGPGGEGALKRLVPRWLAEAPFAAMIADSAPARFQHGGEGARYVYLRRKR